MGWNEEQSAILSIIPHVTGLFSFVGSSSIIFMILNDRRNKLSKPYYRLLFAMCIFDAFSSIALGLSTWPIPVGSKVYTPLGNVKTCSAQAFFIQANIASPIYNFMLSFCEYRIPTLGCWMLMWCGFWYTALENTYISFLSLCMLCGFSHSLIYYTPQTSSSV